MTSSETDSGAQGAARWRLWTLVPLALATLGALAVLGVLTMRLRGASPPRDVAFEGGWDDYQPSCHGPDYFAGGVAFTACAWAYDRRALVRFDPELARATVLHRWEENDGNIPAIRLVRQCGSGTLFVIEETRQTTLVVVDGDRVVARVADVPGERVLGAACRGEARDAELFVETETHAYEILRVTSDTTETVVTIAPGELPGPTRQVLGAWLEGDAWHLVLATQGELGNTEVLTGAMGEPFTPVPGVGEWSPCARGEPGGWMGACYDQTIVTRGPSGGLAVVTADPEALLAVIYGDRDGAVGTTTVQSNGVRFGGLAEGALALRDASGNLLRAERGTGAGLLVADRRYTAIEVGTRALPLSGGRVAVWGAIGKEVIRLGRDLHREDGLGVAERVLRPLGRFRASANSTFDQVCYAVLVASSSAWLVLLFALLVVRRKRLPVWSRRTAWTFVVLCIIGGAGLLRVVAWL